MSTAKTSDDQADSKQPANRGKVIQPLNEDELKKHLEEQKATIKSNADILAELAAKTAELTKNMQDDPNSLKERTLHLDEEALGDTAILAAMDADEREVKSKDDYAEMNPAAELIRAKLDKLYKKEPNAAEEAVEATTVPGRSKHQEFMYQLTNSGKSLAEIQTEWHNYYVSLPDDEKHAVWQEFYSKHARISAYAQHTAGEKPPMTQEPKQLKQTSKHHFGSESTRSLDPKELKSQLLDRLSAGGKLKPVHHLKSLLFGISLAGVVGLGMAFVFFNEVFIAPFISPSKTVSATPIIGQLNEPVGPEPKIIIPKINLEVPVVYDVDTVEEQAVQDGLERGVVHYATSPEPGQQGNVVIVGHSSNNILNSGKYKFAFVLLRRLENDDTFFLHKDGVRYTYKVYEKKVVSPSEVSVLGPASRPNTVTLITCDPPGTSLNRLVIVAEQISPDPTGNQAAPIDVQTPTEPAQLPSNAPSLWSRLWPF